jgi:Cys-tRNA(Pro) deacylase
MKYHPVTKQITNLLKKNKIWYETFEHEPVRTSEEAANVRTGYGIRQGAKALIIRFKKKGERKYVMLVLSGDARFDAKKVKKQIGSSKISFADEKEVVKLTDGVKPGGVPPLGNLFKIPVYTDKGLLTNEKIVFNAGDRSFSIAMKSKDYIKLVKPNVENIC